jgi:hypothetical protein
VREDGDVVVLVGDGTPERAIGRAAVLMSSSAHPRATRVLYDVCTGPLQLVRRLNTIMHRNTDARSFVTAVGRLAFEPVTRAHALT